jgi:hypothetical protein
MAVLDPDLNSFRNVPSIRIVGANVSSIFNFFEETHTVVNNSHTTSRSTNSVQGFLFSSSATTFAIF